MKSMSEMPTIYIYIESNGIRLIYIYIGLYRQFLKVLAVVPSSRVLNDVK